MSQFDFGTIIAAEKSGSELAGDLNAWRDAELSQHSGSARPAYAVAGTVWLDTSGTPWNLYVYDGTSDVLIGQVNATTHAFGQEFSTELKVTMASPIVRLRNAADEPVGALFSGTDGQASVIVYAGDGTFTAKFLNLTYAGNLVWDGNEVWRHTIAQAKAGDGSLGAPAYSFNSDPDTGFGWISANRGALIAGGALAIEYTASSVYLHAVTSTVGSAANLWINSSTFQLARSTSSKRYKKNIKRYGDGLAKLALLKPVTFQSRNKEEAGRTFAGFTAEDVHDSGLTEFVDYDTEGRPDALQYPHMVALLAAALQEEVAAREAIEARLEALEAA